MKLKVVIQTLNNKQGYIVICEDGRVFEAKTIAEAIELKQELQNGN